MNKRPECVEAFSKVLQPFIGVTIVESLHEIKNTVAKLSADLRDSDQRITSLKKENDDLKEIVQINSRLNSIEAYSRIENLVINGLPEKFAEKMVKSTATQNTNDMENSSQSESVFLDFCWNMLHTDIRPLDLSICHRLPKKGKWQI